MFNQKKIAIMGTGNIAKIMARTIKRMKNVKCYAVASRDMDRAQAFAKEFGVKRAYGSYEEMMADNRIDLVYIYAPFRTLCQYEAVHREWISGTV